MKKRGLLVVGAAMLMLGASVQAEEELSDDWKDFQIQIEDQMYQFPMMYEDFTAHGWTAEDAEGVELEPNQYNMITFMKGNARCTVQMVNLGLNNEPIENCIVGGISIDNYYWEPENGTVTLPGGIVWGQADVAAIKEAYGTPSDTYEGDTYTELTYQTDIYNSVDMTVYKESGVLEKITVQNFGEPEGFNAGEVSEEVPEAVTSYQKPETLSENLEDYQIELDGHAYALPVPICVLIEDGWEFDESASDAVVKAKNRGWVTLRKGGQEIRELASNPESYATIPQNCWLEELVIGGYTLEAEGALPGGIQTGMAEADFLAILDGAGVAYEVVSENDNFKYYEFNKKGYDQGFEATVYTSDDGNFEKDTVIEISCRNEF